MTSVLDVQHFIAGAAQRVGPSVVGLGRGWGLGSGVVIADGQVLTNAHNLRRDEVTVTFADGRQAAGGVAGVERDLDLAVLSVDTAGAPPVQWEPGGAPSIGTHGRMPGAIWPSFRGPRGRRVRDAVEHTAPLPRGSSGGPLVDADGNLLGLNSLRLDGGLILAVPATAAMKDRVTLLGRGEAPTQHRLGVAVAPPRVARRLRRAVGLSERDGLLARAVEDDGPAARAGIERGDLIVAAGGREIDGVDALYAALDAVPPAGGDLDLAIVRGTDERSITVTFEGARETV